jgi:ubiquinone/menaquinone biosynthesis C-methylase UbiE
MLERVLETEVMDTPEEAIDYDSMDHSEVNRLFSQDFFAVWQSHHWPGESSAEFDSPAEVLDLGTGTARIPIAILRRARQEETAAAAGGARPAGRGRPFRIVGIDLAVHMLHLARANVEAAGFSSWIRLERVDAKQLPYDDGHFDAVISNSIVHHIPDPAAALREACRVLSPGGLVFIRDLSRPSSREVLSALVDTYAKGANEHQRRMFADSLGAALTLGEMRSLVESLGFDPGTVTKSSDRHWTWKACRARGISDAGGKGK